MDPIIMIGMPPLLLLVVALPLAVVLAIAVGLLHYHDRCDAEDAAAAAAGETEAE
ncbi:hypothetical protein H7U34_08840 [Collinsella tanakaei]|nr:hypothetical protein [Collinsella tanakaei]